MVLTHTSMFAVLHILNNNVIYPINMTLTCDGVTNDPINLSQEDIDAQEYMDAENNMTVPLSKSL